MKRELKRYESQKNDPKRPLDLPEAKKTQNEKKPGWPGRGGIGFGKYQSLTIKILSKNPSRQA